MAPRRRTSFGNVWLSRIRAFGDDPETWGVPGTEGSTSQSCTEVEARGSDDLDDGISDHTCSMVAFLT